MTVDGARLSFHDRAEEQKIRRGCDPEKRRVGGSCGSVVMGVVL